MTLEARAPLSTEVDWRRLHVGDARDIAQLMPNEPAIQLTITSPPYWNAVDYGVANQIGHGQGLDEYLDDMEQVLAALFDRTSASGSLWLIVDTLKAATPAGVGRVVPLPFLLSSRAERVGWVLHDVVIWHKDRTLPWSNPGRLRNAFEYVLFLVKGPRFKYHLDRVRSQEGLVGWWHRYPERYNPRGAAPTNVWDFPITVQGSWSNGLIEHDCPLPRGLVRRIIDLCSDEGDLVCDPFAGVGTVLAIAAATRRKYAGIELSTEFAEQFYSTVLPDELRQAAEPSEDGQSDAFAALVVRLRLAKIPRVLGRALRAQAIPFTAIVAVAKPSDNPPPSSTRFGTEQLTVYVPDAARDAATAFVTRALSRRPLSKFGVNVESAIEASSEWSPVPDPERWSRIFLDRRSLAPLDDQAVPSEADPLVLVDLSPSDLAIPR